MPVQDAGLLLMTKSLFVSTQTSINKMTSGILSKIKQETKKGKDEM